jgi:WD40 repeat protein
MVVTGNQKGFLTVFNVSTGKPCCQSERIVAISVCPGAAAVTKPAVAAFSLRRVSLGEKQSSSKGGVTSAITAMAFDDAVNPGAILWVGTESGAIVAVGFDIRTGGILSKTKRTVHISSFVIPEGGATGATSATPQFAETAITSLQTKTWLSREARDPTLLANAGSNTLLLFRVLTKPQGALQLRRSISLSSSPKRPLSSKSEALASLPIRSNFCPLMSFSEGACVISGSLDCSVYFFDVERDSTRPCVNRLLGHAAPTLDVAFNYDESLLASCDASGLVIIWKREKK